MDWLKSGGICAVDGRICVPNGEVEKAISGSHGLWEKVCGFGDRLALFAIVVGDRKFGPMVIVVAKVVSSGGKSGVTGQMARVGWKIAASFLVLCRRRRQMALNPEAGIAVSLGLTTQHTSRQHMRVRSKILIAISQTVQQ